MSLLIVKWYNNVRGVIIIKKLTVERIKYLELLSQTYANVNQASTEIINLQAILNLPKGTEHFVSDIHGEYDSFNHVLRNASGVIKNYIEEIFGDSLMDISKRTIATLIYYPERKLERVKTTEPSLDEWYRINLLRLVQICKRVSSKYTRSKVRKSLPKEFSYILEEIIHENMDKMHKQAYYSAIIDSIIRLGKAENFIIAISNVIQRLAIDHLHIIGDIYDRGNSADRIMDVLEKYHSVDIQWGNHDIVWMGASAGSEACVCNVVRTSAKYFNLHTIEESYGINLVPLATFAMETYKDTTNHRFKPNDLEKLNLSEKEIEIISKMHKAITVIQLKMEAKIIKDHPEYNMTDRLMLDKINIDKKTITIDNEEYPLIDYDFPTINIKDPYALTPEEKEVIDKTTFSFRRSSKLNQHVKFLFNKGSMYTVYNDNLLFHGCIPLNADGTFRDVLINQKPYKGRALLDVIEFNVRKGFFAKESSTERKNGQDLMWYLWCGKDSPLFGKDKMTTFERYFLKNKLLTQEHKDVYYDWHNDENICKTILEEFGLDPSRSHIINGHVPVKVTKGESPIKAGGKLLVIDGGFSKAYQQVTGIAGYTLISNSQGLLLASHEPFVSFLNVIENEIDIVTNTTYIERNAERKKVGDTDSGKLIKSRISDLEALLQAYNSGIIKEVTFID